MAADTHTPAAGSADASTEVAHEGGGGLPQFQFQHWGGQIVWLLLIFAVLYTVIGRVFVPRIRRILDTRAETIATAVSEARRVQDEAEVQAKAAQAEVQDARTSARQLAADAKTKANAEAARRQAEEDARLQTEMTAAEARIRSLRDKAMTNVETIASETAQAMIEKLTGDKVSSKDIQGALAKGAA